MQKYHPKYKIKQGDNLQTISKLFDLDQDIWVRYHNTMCRLDEIIRKEIPENLTEIYLLPELWDKEDEFYSMLSPKKLSEKKVNQEVLFGYNNTLPMRKCPNILAYNVVLTFEKVHTINTIKYQIYIKWLGLENINHIIEINKGSHIYINDKEPDLVADELAIKVSQAIYPLELIVTQQDGIIGINNFAEIQKRWQRIRQEITDYNEGETLDKYLALNDRVLEDEDRLFRSLQNDWFLHTYFNKTYQTYGSNYSFSNKISAPFVFDTDGVEYTVQQEIDNTIDSDGFINIRMKGEISDERSCIDLQNGLSYPRYSENIPLKGEYNAQYQIDAQYNTISKVTLDCNIVLEDNKKTSIIINQIKNN